jgi:hypothetical protein
MIDRLLAGDAHLWGQIATIVGAIALTVLICILEAKDNPDE